MSMRVLCVCSLVLCAASCVAGQLPEPPEQWYLRVQFPDRHMTVREAWQTRWTSVDKMATPEMAKRAQYSLNTTTWMDRRRSVAIGWSHNYVAGTWTNPAFQWPLSMSFRGDLMYTKGPKVNTSSGWCDTYTSSPDDRIMGASYEMLYLAETNTPVAIHLVFGGRTFVQLVIDRWLTGDAVPMPPAVDSGAPNYPPEPSCEGISNQSACSAVLSSYCHCHYEAPEQCPSGRCIWSTSGECAPESSSSVPSITSFGGLAESSTSSSIHAQGSQEASVSLEGGSAARFSSSSALSITAGSTGSSLNGMVFVRDELWMDHDAFAWSTAFWAEGNFQEAIYKYLQPFNYSAIWRDDLYATFNSTSESVDVYHATGTMLKLESPVDLVYRAGTDTLLSFNSSFLLTLADAAVPVSSKCTVQVFEKGLPISDSVFTPPPRCTGSPFGARPHASDAFSHLCYSTRISNSQSAQDVTSVAGSLAMTLTGFALIAAWL
eukprot:m51a1_g6853 hypothetical protein (489) ;mRNA; r:108153-110168